MRLTRNAHGGIMCASTQIHNIVPVVMGIVIYGEQLRILGTVGIIVLLSSTMILSRSTTKTKRATVAAYEAETE
jgi:hypothetical protein